ncbi:hypothetical protein [Timonella senegalensis]|uniref:hypothetical protein n=1 Tax=Timonella senegalensis TaxID=1465825 RepID=UPI002FDCC0AB
MANKPETKAKDPYDAPKAEGTDASGPDAVDAATKKPSGEPEQVTPAEVPSAEPEAKAEDPAAPRASRTEQFTAMKADGTTVTIERDINTGAQREV